MPKSAIIMTRSGRLIDLLNFKPEDVDIYDIAAHLSKICRFGGASRRFYSVAEHSVLVSRFLPAPLKCAGLLHDAAEAYLGDVTTPLKHLMPDYLALGQSISAVITQALNIDRHHDPLIKAADTEALMLEAAALMPANADYWATHEDVHKLKVVECLPPNIAELSFLKRYSELQGVRHG